MRLEILVEGSIDKAVLKVLLKKIIKDTDVHLCNIHRHRGLGIFPNFACKSKNKKNNEGKLKANKQTLLGCLHSKLKIYGKEKNDNIAVIVLVDLDDKDCVAFKKQLNDIAASCKPAPQTFFCIAIEELEAWFLGDRTAVKKAYSNAKEKVMDSYKQDEICGTWEKLADAVHKGGVRKLHSQYGKYSQSILIKKAEWAMRICPYMNVDNNRSPSFCFFRDRIRNMIKKHKQPIPSHPNA